MTTYIVLVEGTSPETGPTGNTAAVPSGKVYRLLGTYNASGPNQAIRALAGDTPGTYIAVPERNWSEVTAELEQPPARLVLHEGESDLPDPGVIPGQTELGEEPEPEEDAA